jgi:acyl-CoA synthetase (AMP-forming)/AMP-acid ligase II
MRKLRGGKDQMVLIKEQIQQRSQIESGLLFRSLVRWATLRPEATFLVEAETGRTLNYKQALAGVAALRQALGETPCRLILALPGGITAALIWLSALSGGHHLIPVAPNATDGEKSALGQKQQPDVIIVEHEEDADAFGKARVLVFTRSACEALVERSVPLPLPDSREGYAYLATSGSTGEPKGVVLTERQIAWAAEQVRQSHELSPRDRGLTVLPFFHVNAPVVSLCASLLAGSTVVIASRFSRQPFWSWVEDYHITWVSLVPTIVAILLETEKPAFLPGALRFVRTGSAALPPANMHAFETRFGIPVIETYGLSEAASQIVANPLPPGQHKAGSAGRPTGVTLRICLPRLSEDTQPLCDVPEGELGEVCITGPAVIEGYQSNEGGESFQDGWFRTGDLGYLDSEGYLFLKGRMREVINRGGENIAPREIEELLQRYSLVREAAVVGRPDAIYGEQVVAYLAVREHWSATDLAGLRQYAALHLSAPKVPVDMIVLDDLPRNATGKIDRRLLRERELARSMAER